MHGLAVYVKEGLPSRDLSLESSADSYLCFRLALLHSVSISFSSIDHLLCLCARFLILFHLTYMRFSRSTHLLMYLSLETLTSITRTGLPILVELIDLVNCYHFSISNDLTQMVNFPTRIPDCDFHSPALLDLFLSSDTSICSTMAFPPFRNSDHVVLVSIDFPSNSQQDALFHRIAYDYSRTD